MLVWSFHDRIYTFCKSVLFSNIECLIFEFFRFLNWRKALKVFYIWILHVKLLKYITSVQETLSLISLPVQEGLQSLCQVRASFPTAEGHSSVLSRKSANLILKPILISGFILNVLMLVQLSNYRLTGLVLSSSVFGPLVNVRFSCKLYLLWLHNWHLDHEQSWLTLLRGSTFTGFWLRRK